MTSKMSAQVEAIGMGELQDKDEDSPDAITNCDKDHHGWAKYRHSRVCETIVFLVLLGLNSADLISDWLFYASVTKTEPGLVYGPPEQELITGMLVFSIIGVFTFVFEVVNHGKEIYTEKPWINVDLAAAITIWIEDIPQIVLNVFIAACREEAISVFQLTKASVILFGIVIRIIISLVRYCNKKSFSDLTKHTTSSALHVTYRAFIMIGLFILAAGAIMVFVFTQTHRNEDGSVNFNIPDTLFNERLDNERYFHNVSIFFHHPSLDVKSNPSDRQTNWIRMVTIYDVTGELIRGEVFEYEFNEVTDKITFSQSDERGITTTEACYYVNTDTRLLTPVFPPGCNSSFISPSENPTSIIIKFHFIAINDRQVFGDISFNVKVKHDGKCKTADEHLSESIEDEGNDPTALGAIHYYRTDVSGNLSETYHTLEISPTLHEFYKADKHLIDITDVWQTGFSKCESSGSIAPHQSHGIDVPCL